MQDISVRWSPRFIPQDEQVSSLRQQNSMLCSCLRLLLVHRQHVLEWAIVACESLEALARAKANNFPCRHVWTSHTNWYIHIYYILKTVCHLERCPDRYTLSLKLIFGDFWDDVVINSKMNFQKKILRCARGRPENRNFRPPSLFFFSFFFFPFLFSSFPPSLLSFPPLLPSPPPFPLFLFSFPWWTAFTETEVKRWRDGEMERWRDEEMKRWRDEEMERLIYSYGHMVIHSYTHILIWSYSHTLI